MGGQGIHRLSRPAHYLSWISATQRNQCPRKSRTRRNVTYRASATNYIRVLSSFALPRRPSSLSSGEVRKAPVRNQVFESRTGFLRRNVAYYLNKSCGSVNTYLFHWPAAACMLLYLRPPRRISPIRVALLRARISFICRSMQSLSVFVSWHSTSAVKSNVRGLFNKNVYLEKLRYVDLGKSYFEFCFGYLCFGIVFRFPLRLACTAFCIVAEIATPLY